MGEGYGALATKELGRSWVGVTAPEKVDEDVTPTNLV